MAAITALKSSVLKPSFCRLASTVNSAVFQKYGCPTNVLKVQKTQLKDVGKKDIQIRMLASPVTGFDLSAIAGKNPMGLSFPSVAGAEGVGIIQKIGEDVTAFKELDTVMIVRPIQGTWSEQIVVSEDQVLPAPVGIASEVSSALIKSAGIAYRLLADFATLKSGDFVMQNDASSPVGLAVMQLCKARGVKTINVVKDSGEYSQLFRLVESMGGDVIVRESQLHGVDFKKIMDDLPVPKLALNGRGGSVMTDTCRLLRDTTVVTYNESSNEPFSLTASYLVNNHLCLKGFNMNNWLASAPMSDIKSMVDDLAAMIQKDDLRLYLKKDKFSQVTDVVAEACSPLADRTPVLSISFTICLFISGLPFSVNGFQSIHCSVNSQQTYVKHHSIGFNTAPFSAGSCLIVNFSFPIRLFDLIPCLFFFQIIQLHNSSDAVFLISINKRIYTVGVIAQHIVRTASHENSRPLFRQFSDNRRLFLKDLITQGFPGLVTGHKCPVFNAAGRICGQKPSQHRLIHSGSVLIADTKFLGRHMKQIVVIKGNIQPLGKAVPNLMASAPELSAYRNNCVLHHICHSSLQICALYFALTGRKQCGLLFCL